MQYYTINVLKRFIHFFFKRQILQKEKENRESLSSAGLLHKWLERSELIRSEAGSQGLLPSLLHKCQAQRLGQSSAVFPGLKQNTGLDVEYLSLELVPIRDAGIVGVGLIHCAPHWLDFVFSKICTLLHHLPTSYITENRKCKHIVRIRDIWTEN